MINSRDINELHPHVANLCRIMKNKCKEQGIDLIITSTYRDAESQSYLYAQGRTSAGRKVTNAKAGQSYHNYRLAFDVVPIVGGKCVWNDANLWKTIGKLGKDSGLEWAGDWKRFKEMPHFQYTQGLKLADLQNGNTIT